MAAQADALTGTYYLEHFEALLAQVEGRYGDLFIEAEQALLASFKVLPVDARALYVRFLGRRGQAFRQDKLNYPELALPQALASLEAAGFIAAAPPTTALLALLTKAELAQLFGLDARQKRLDLLAQAEALPFPALPFHIWQLRFEDFFRRCLLLYFGNPYQDLSEFVVTALEHVRYEAYALDVGSRFYRDRGHLERHFALAKLAQELEATEEAELPALATSWPEGDDRRWQKLTLALARRLERAGATAQALAFYAKTPLPPSRERQVRLIQKQAGDQAAWQALAPVLQGPMDASEQDFIECFGQRLAKKLGQQLPAAPVSAVAEEVRPLPAGKGSVELKALQYFQAGVHGENQLLTGLFGLLFWDIVFAPVPGAFFHPFQRGPQDLFSPDFTEKRRALIEARLKEIEGDWLPRAQACRRQKQGITNALVHWPFWTEESLELAGAIPGAHLAAWFRHFLSDPRHHRSGFPDLLVLEEGGYALVEVKGPGDRLQPGQKRWLRELIRLGHPARVLHLK
ncbi:VRR-NUC domain-containing protein [Gallaecimonas kandeliae]|uniref:VRR-NUC domain-containing protein n=1 Tax=Gallaecimonas kandeliae TaxID=3029055 RepID=UPI002647CAC9|nr:VRR-NUC domain-containing protein [Gallaecimonas kandeliae]WKE66475.1 VRR-NUC domain-containing protein [Gallaecimonas kandeliae]